jgi:hypothetical protein
MTAPGLYQARMSMADWTASQPFEVKMDPRVLAEGISREDVLAQLELSLEVRDTLDRARETARSLEDAKEAGDDGAKTLTPELEEVRSRLVTDPVRYSRPMLIDQLTYLYQNLQRADQRPGRDAYERFEMLRTEWNEILDRLEKLLPVAAQPQ